MKFSDKWQKVNQDLYRIYTSEGWLVRSKDRLQFIPDENFKWNLSTTKQVFICSNILENRSKLKNCFCSFFWFKNSSELISYLLSGVVCDLVILDDNCIAGSESLLMTYLKKKGINHIIISKLKINTLNKLIENFVVSEIKSDAF
ncbi:hypothetical protein DID75_01185 [Candidatus Marinamargulisbacteria bacterium SCGC AG-410-N11]|nr:hypothetical protein DID75_01185 [Candidatus Marinamargulisbacteria bacterium SCGC AG-410-N11]